MSLMKMGITQLRKGVKMNKQFGPLFALASNGKTKTWQASVHETEEGYGFITYTFGYENGTHQHQEKAVKSGKNIGKKNETTAYEQACNDAESKFNKKQDAGYQEDKATLSTPILPMLAHPYEKRKHNINWPCYVQPKIDGVRCTVGYRNEKPVMFTRKGKSMTPMPHISDTLEAMYHAADSLGWDVENLYIDGELYSDELTFQELAGTLRRHKNTEETLGKIYLVVFDIFYSNKEVKFIDRLTMLNELFDTFLEINVELIDTSIAMDESQVEERLELYLREGYEGIMLRNTDGLYKMNHRSADLQKWKRFQDDEFMIVGYKQGTGVEKGCVIWECESNELEVPNFWVRPKGDHESRKTMYKAGNDYIEKLLTVRFQELTNDGIPRFPVGISIRDYE